MTTRLVSLPAGVERRPDGRSRAPAPGGAEAGDAPFGSNAAHEAAVAAIAAICAALRELAAPEADLPLVVGRAREHLRWSMEAELRARGGIDAAPLAPRDMGALMVDALEALAAAVSRSRTEAAQRERHLRDILDRARHALRESALDEANAAIARPIVHAPPAPDPWSARLTDRERDVLNLMVAGVIKTNDIAQALVISPATAKKHIRHILAKLEVESRRAAVRRAAASGW
jgi:ATP/maltotriose-dependent transcriptional regulator MalT